MKENTKRYIKLSIILYIVILSVALVSTLAWFIFEKSATISTAEDSKIVAGEYLEICIDDKDDDSTNDVWASDIEALNVSQFPDVSVTPDGTVWYPTELDDNDNLLFGEQGKGVYLDVTNTSDGYFMKLDLKVKASVGLDVYLHQDSFVNGVDNDKTDAAGRYSKDSIAGASRVAFFTEEGVKLLWVPNDTYQLSVDESTGEVTDFTFTGTPESSYKYLNVVDGMVTEGNEHNIWKPEEVNIVCGNESLAYNDFTNDQKPILKFDEAGEQKLTVYIWIEGTDREANTIFSGGSLNYQLVFTGILRKTASTVNIDDVAYDDGKLIYSSTGESVGAEIIYSYDKKEWTPYSDGNPDLAKGQSVLYVRAKETAKELASSIKEITLQ